MPVPIAELFITVGADTAAAVNGLQGLSNSIHRTASGVQSAGRSLTLGLTAPIVGAAGAVINAGIDFEHAFTGVRKTVDETTTSVPELRAEILRLAGTDAVGGKSAVELANIAQAAGSLGINGTPELTRFIQVIGKLGVATDGQFGSMEELAREFANASLLIGASDKDWERVADVITELGNATEATESEIIHHTKRIGAALNAVGVAPQEILGIAAALASVRLEPEAAGTAISTFFSDMVKGANAGEKATKENAQAISNLRDKFLDLSASLQVAEARQQEFGRNTPKSVVLANALAIEKYKREMAQTSVEQAKLTDEAAGGKSKLAAFARVAGVTQEEFKTLVNTNPATAFEKIIHGLKRIETEEGIGAQLQALKDIGVTNVRELLVFQTLANSPEQLSDALQKANAQWAEGGALQTEVQKAMQDTANQLTAIKNRIEADFIPVWDQQFRPAIEKASTFMQQSLIPNMETWIGALNTMDPEVLKNVGLAFAGLAALGPVLFVIGQIISIIALLASPAGVIFAAIAAIVALKLAWDNNWFGIRDTTFKVIDAVHDKMAELAIGMRTVFANAIGGLAQVFATIGGLLPGTFGQPFKDAAAALEAYKKSLDEATLAKSNALTASNIVQAQTGSTALNPVLQGDVGTLAPATAPLPILNQQQVGDAGMNFMAPVVEFSGPLTIANGIDAQNVANQAAAAVLQALIDSEQASAAPVTQPLPGAPTGFEGRSILAR